MFEFSKVLFFRVLQDVKHPLEENEFNLVKMETLCLKIRPMDFPFLSSKVSHVLCYIALVFGWASRTFPSSKDESVQAGRNILTPDLFRGNQFEGSPEETRNS